MSSHSCATRHLSVGLVCLALAAAGNVAQAALTLTPYAAACPGRCFSLHPFARDFPFVGTATTGIGPLGLAYRNDGNVLVSGYATSKIYLLSSHANTQVGPFSVTADYGPGNANAMGLAQIPVAGMAGKWKYYLSQNATGRIIEIDSSGAFIQTIVSMPGALGLAPYPPKTGTSAALKDHLFATDGTTIWDVNPVAKTKTGFASPGGSADGLTFGEDGKTIYVALNSIGVVRAYNSDFGSAGYGTPSWQSPVHVGPDGTAIGIGTLAGYIYVNYNDGDVREFGVSGSVAGQDNLIATGGTRGDFIATDPDFYTDAGYPTLLLTQTDQIVRLDPPGGGFFGPPTSSTVPVSPVVPALGAWGMILLSATLLLLGGLFVARRRGSSQARA